MNPSLVLVTPDGLAEDELAARVEAVATALAPGTLAVQVREKCDLARRERLARALRRVTRVAGQWLVVNSDLHLALALGADGVHLPPGAPDIAEARAAMPHAWISVPAHDDEDIGRAREANAALVSPIYASPGKGVPRGIEALRAARRTAPHLAIYALGGVDVSNVDACIEAGATGVAVIRAVFDAPDPAAAARALLRGTPRSRP